MKKVVTSLATALFIAASASAQVTVSSVDTAVVIDFDSTLSGVSNGQFDGTGFDSSPALGQLDSDAWSMTGMSDGSFAFGGSATTGDFARGNATGAQSTGGLFAFGTTDRQLMIQPGGNDWTPGTLGLKAVNSTGGDISTISVSYDLYVRNDADRSSSFDFTYSLDGGSNFLTAGLTDPLFTYTSTEAQDSDGWVLVGTASSSITLSSALLNNGEVIFQWAGDDIGGSGSRDEFGLDNISVSMGVTAIPEPTTYATIMGLVTLAFVMIRRNRKAKS